MPCVWRGPPPREGRTLEGPCVGRPGFGLHPASREAAGRRRSGARTVQSAWHAAIWRSGRLLASVAHPGTGSLDVHRPTSFPALPREWGWPPGRSRQGARATSSQGSTGPPWASGAAWPPHARTVRPWEHPVTGPRVTLLKRRPERIRRRTGSVGVLDQELPAASVRRHYCPPSVTCRAGRISTPPRHAGRAQAPA